MDTDFSHDREAKDTWLNFIQNSLQKLANTISDAMFAERQKETKQSEVVEFTGKVAADVFCCDKHLISGVNFRLSFLRNRPDFRFIYGDEVQVFKIKKS